MIRRHVYVRCVVRSVVTVLAWASNAKSLHAGVQSVYWWEGKVQTDNELLLIMKTQQALLGELTTAVKENHPYDEPEVISLPITGGSEGYLKWIRNSTKGSES